MEILSLATVVYNVLTAISPFDNKLTKVRSLPI